MNKKILLVAASALMMASGVPAFAQMSPNTANSPGGTDAGTTQGRQSGNVDRAQVQKNQDMQPTSGMSPNTANSPGGSDAGTAQHQSTLNQ